MSSLRSPRIVDIITKMSAAIREDESRFSKINDKFSQKALYPELDELCSFFTKLNLILSKEDTINLLLDGPADNREVIKVAYFDRLYKPNFLDYIADNRRSVNKVYAYSHYLHYLYYPALCEGLTLANTVLDGMQLSLDDSITPSNNLLLIRYKDQNERNKTKLYRYVQSSESIVRIHEATARTSDKPSVCISSTIAADLKDTVKVLAEKVLLDELKKLK